MSGSVQLPNWSATNALLDLPGVMGAAQQYRGTQQTLDNQDQLRSLAPQLAAANPLAMATASTLGPQGTAAVNSVDATVKQRQAQAQYSQGLATQIASSVAALPDEQSAAAAYPFLRQQAITSGMNPLMLPEQFPGRAGALAIRNTAVPVATAVEATANRPYPAGQDPGALGIPGVSGTPNFTNAMSRSESGGNPTKVNAQGFAGEFQFGAPRLSALGVYQPTSGEIDPQTGRWNGQMNGQFNIPQFPDVKTKADFLANEPAQRAVFGQHVADIDRAIAQTPGTDRYDPNSLRAMAHLGGTAGMQRYVASGGTYDPADANGTRLSDYARKFAGPNGHLALQQAFGHPDGPYAQPQQQAVGPAPAPPQVASTNPSAGMQQVAAAATGPQPPVRTAASALTDLGAAGAQATPAAPRATPSPAATPANQSAPAQPQTGVGTPMPPGSVPLMVKGQAVPVQGMPGFVKSIAPNGQQGIMRESGYQNTAKLAERPNPNGGIDMIAPSGEVVNPAIPNSRDVQKSDYEADRPKGEAMGEAAAAAQTNMQRIQQMRDLNEKVQSGPNGAFRAQIAAMAQQYLPSQTAADFVKRMVGMSDTDAAQELTKLGIVGAGAMEKSAVGSNGGYQATKLFQSANPGLELGQGANRAILASQLIGQQADKDYADGAQAHFNRHGDAFRGNTGDYVPLSKFNQDWTAQRNPQVYAGAMGALSGLPVNDAAGPDGKVQKGWANGLSDAEYRRALDVVSRADPSAIVNGRTGRLSMQPPTAQGAAQQRGAAPAQAAPAVPAVGTIMEGHKFLGGDPHSPASWQVVN